MKNLIKFIEIPAADFTRAIKFYETVLNIQLTVSDDYETEKMAFFSDFSTEPNVAISWAANFHPSKDGVLMHFSVGCIEETLGRVNSKGGKTIQPKTKIEADNMGYFALFSDSEGNTMGLYAEK